MRGSKLSFTSQTPEEIYLSYVQLTISSTGICNLRGVRVQQKKIVYTYIYIEMAGLVIYCVYTAWDGMGSCKDKTQIKVKMFV